MDKRKIFMYILYNYIYIYSICVCMCLARSNFETWLLKIMISIVPIYKGVFRANNLIWCLFFPVIP